MDQSLDEIIGDRPPRRGERGPPQSTRRPPPPRAPRREEYPRDGVRKYRHDDRADLNADWVHDKFDDHRDRHGYRPPSDRHYGSSDRAPGPTGGAKVRVDNLYYELTEPDLRELFESIGPTASIELVYDRFDRFEGTAYVIYRDSRHARRAVDEFDGQNARGQPIKLTLMPSAPTGASRGTLFDRIERPSRSLFERIEGGGGAARLDDSRRRRGPRSESPGRRHTPDNIDRYVPGRRASRSPIRRRGTPRETGRRPGQRGEESKRGGGRSRANGDGKPTVGGRPRKTAEELDAEMEDYWGGKEDESAKTGSQNATVQQTQQATNGSMHEVAADADIDMIE